MKKLFLPCCIILLLVGCSMPPLYRHAATGDVKELAALLDSGADINENFMGWTPLVGAVSNGQTETARLLLARGADINATTDTAYYRNWTPLMYAARNGHANTVRFLLERGADVSVASDACYSPSDCNSYNALQLAAKNGHVQVAEMIREAMEEAEFDSAQKNTTLQVQQQYVAGNPNESKGFVLLSYLYSDAGKNSEAVAAAKRALELKPDSSAAFFQLGQVYRKQRLYQEALAAFDSAARLRPAKVAYHKAIGGLYLEQGMYAEAASAYMKASELAPDDGSNFLALAHGQRLAGKSDAALAAVNRSLALHAQGQASTKVFALLSLIHRDLGQRDDAARDAQQAYALDPNDDWARLAMGAAHLDGGRLGEAVELLRQVGNNPEARLLEAITHARHRDFNAALAVFDAATVVGELPAANVPLQRARQAFFAQCRPRLAELRAQAAAREAGGDLRGALAQLAEAMRIADPADETTLLTEMLRLLRLMPSLPEIPEEARRHALRGEAMIGNGEFASAVGEFRAALRIAPYVAKLHFNAALLYADMKKYREAIRSMKTYLEMAPDAPDARPARDEIYKWEYALDKAGR